MKTTLLTCYLGCSLVLLGSEAPEWSGAGNVWLSIFLLLNLANAWRLLDQHLKSKLKEERKAGPGVR